MILTQILSANQNYLAYAHENRTYSSNFPSKEVAIVTCMDPRLVNLLEPALGLSQGDATIIKTAGNIVDKADSDVIRSLVVAVFKHRCKEIVVIGHSDCGMAKIDTDVLSEEMRKQGIAEQIADSYRLREWLGCFGNEADNVIKSVKTIKYCGKIPTNIIVHGLFMNIVTKAVKHLITV